MIRSFVRPPPTYISYEYRITNRKWKRGLGFLLHKCYRSNLAGPNRESFTNHFLRRHVMKLIQWKEPEAKLSVSIDSCFMAIPICCTVVIQHFRNNPFTRRDVYLSTFIAAQLISLLLFALISGKYIHIETLIPPGGTTINTTLYK